MSGARILRFLFSTRYFTAWLDEIHKLKLNYTGNGAIIKKRIWKKIGAVFFGNHHTKFNIFLFSFVFINTHVCFFLACPLYSKIWYNILPSSFYSFIFSWMFGSHECINYARITFFLEQYSCIKFHCKILQRYLNIKSLWSPSI